MKSFTKSLLTYLVIAFVAISCGGSDNPIPNSTIGKNCKLSKVTQVSDGYTSVTTLKHNNTNLIIEILTLSTVSNKEEQSIYTLSYNAKGQLATRKLINPTRVSDYIFIYKYNGQIEKIQTSTLFTGDSIPYKDELKYEYNTNGKIVKMISNDLFRVYNYDSKGNLSSVQTEYANNVQLTTYQYDDKKNYYNLMQTAFPEEPSYQNINNVLFFDYKRNGVSTISSKYEYVYNLKGLPTKSTAIPKNSSSSIATLEYIDCE